MEDGLPHLLLALAIAAGLILAWRVVLFFIVLVCLAVFLVGVLDVIRWTGALS